MSAGVTEVQKTDEPGIEITLYLLRYRIFNMPLKIGTVRSVFSKIK
jgi:hypothetical protein